MYHSALKGFKEYRGSKCKYFTGKQLTGMVFKMLDNGWKDADICNELGMSAEELVKLKHITGFSKLFEDAGYRQSWVTKNQIKEKVKHKKQLESNGEENE